MTVAALAEELRDGHRTGTARRIVGAGTWLGAGRPVAAGASPLELRTLRGITEYVPGDLTLTALAGTTLAELHEATRANGQRLALDPYGTDDGTLGATVATASAGPGAAAFGTPRDQVLGVAFVTGTGDVVRAGGRVVKNVAGFDLVRLTTGAWGTLGVIAEVSVRLRALPSVDATYTVAIDSADDAAVAAAIASLRAVPFTFEALELLDGATASALAVPGAPAGAIVARAGGSPDVVRGMRAALSLAGDVHEADPSLWARLRGLAGPASCSVRLSHAPARVPDVWHTARRLARAAGGRAHLAIGRTVARVAWMPSETAVGLREAFAGFNGTLIAECLPPDAWSEPELRGAAARDATLQRLQSGVRDALDPARLLNRGILGAAGGDA